MNVLQLIYTSCKKGLSSGTGFQTYSMSGGISEEERREIERFGLYVPPTDLPTQPTEEEIENLFPVALRFFRLESGRFGVCQSRYIGKDYSGRYGNYFCHALILENGRFPVYPIQLYKSPLFRDRLTDEEVEGDSTPQPLPALELDKFALSPAITFDQIMEFIGNTGIEPVKEMVSAAISYDETHRSLILTDSQTRIPYWIAALQMAFPLKLAHNLTFATYIHDPAAINSIVSGVPASGSRFAFSETQRDFENYIFDLESPGNSVIDSRYEFTRNVDLGYTISRESLEEFHHFIDLFDFNAINKELDSIDALFRVARIGVEDLAPERILAAVEFANKYASPGVLGQLADNLQQIIDNLSSKVDFISAGTIAKFLFKISRQSAEKRHLETAYTFFFQSLDHLILHHPQPDLQATESFYNAVRDENIANREEFAGRVLSAKRFDRMNRYISNNPGSLRTEIYFNLVVGTIISFQYTWDFMMENHKLFESFIQSSVICLIDSPANLNRSLLTTVKDKDFFTHLVSFCLTRRIVDSDSPGIFLEAFIHALDNKPGETPAYARTKLIQAGHSDFIYKEYLNLLERSNERQVFFRLYFETVFSKNIDFLRQYFSTAVKDYLEFLPDKDLFEACSKIIGYSEVIRSDDVMKRVVEGVENGLSLSEPKEETLEKISILNKIKKNRKITTFPDITRLILLGIECEKAAVGLAPEKIPTLIKRNSGTYSLKNLDKKRVEEYFAWCSPSLLQLAKSPTDHDILFEWFGTSKLDKQFVLEYITEIKRLIKRHKESGIKILLSFLEFYISTLFSDRDYFVVREKARGHLVKILAGLSKPQFGDIRAKIVKSSAVKEDTGAKHEILRILEDVSQRSKKSIFNRVKKIFHTKKNKNEKTKIKIKK